LAAAAAAAAEEEEEEEKEEEEGLFYINCSIQLKGRILCWARFA
jgi:hypothetical protein